MKGVWSRNKRSCPGKVKKAKKSERKPQIKRGSEVVVITGSEKGKRGKVLELLSKKNRVVIEKIAIRKKHEKPSQKNSAGGIVEREGSLHISNVMLAEKFDKKKKTVK